MTTTDATRVSLRDVREAACRALMAHGASPGEARTAAAMVLDAELIDGVGLAALIDDLTRESWSRTPVRVTDVADPVVAGVADRAASVVLGSPVANRLLREGPLAVELIAGEGGLCAAGVPCAVARSSLLDAVMLEIARTSGADVAVVICPSTRPGPTDPDRDVAHRRGQLRLATPDGRVGVSTTKLPSVWCEMTDGPGVLAQRNPDRDDLGLSWRTAQDRARVRATAAERGLTVETSVWRRVYDASRRYLVPG